METHAPTFTEFKIVHSEALQTTLVSAFIYYTHTLLLHKKAFSTIQRMLHVHKLYCDQTNIKGTVQHCQKFQYSIQYLIQQIANQ